jgi:cytoplasmic tRNA 2-thiolation protein 1
MCARETIKLPKRGFCERCGFVSSQNVCKGCTLLEGLNRGLPKLGIGKSSRAKRIMDSTNYKIAKAHEVVEKF